MKKHPPQAGAGPRNAPKTGHGGDGSPQTAGGAILLPPDGRFARLEKLTDVPAAVWQALAQDGKIGGGDGKMSETETLDLPTQPMGISEAARTYGMSREVIHRWIRRGYIRVVNRGGKDNPTLLDPEDLARAVRLYRASPGQGRDPLRDLKKETVPS